MQTLANPSVRPGGRVLHVGPLALDTPTRGLPGLPRRLQQIWSEARFTAAGRVFDAARRLRPEVVILDGPLLGEWSAPLRGPAFLSTQMSSLGGIPVVWRAAGHDDPATWPSWAAVSNAVLPEPGETAEFRDGRIQIRNAAPGLTMMFDGSELNTDRAASPQSTGEVGPHGVTLLEAGGGRTFIATDSVRFHERTIDATDGSRWQQLLATMRRHMAAVASSEGDDDACDMHVVRWTVRGHGAAWQRLHAAGPLADLLDSLREEADSFDGLPVWAEAIRATADETQQARWADDTTPVGRFAARVAAGEQRPLTDAAVTGAIGLTLIN